MAHEKKKCDLSSLNLKHNSKTILQNNIFRIKAYYIYIYTGYTVSGGGGEWISTRAKFLYFI